MWCCVGGGGEHENLAFIERVDKGQSTTVKDLVGKLTFRAIALVIRSEEGLTLEKSPFLLFHGGNSTFINSFDKTKVSCFYSMVILATLKRSAIKSE